MDKTFGQCFQSGQMGHSITHFQNRTIYSSEANFHKYPYLIYFPSPLSSSPSSLIAPPRPPSRLLLFTLSDSGAYSLQVLILASLYLSLPFLYILPPVLSLSIRLVLWISFLSVPFIGNRAALGDGWRVQRGDRWLRRKDNEERSISQDGTPEKQC